MTPQQKLAMRLVALAALMLMVPMSWKGRLLLGGAGLLAIVVWHRNQL